MRTSRTGSSTRSSFASRSVPELLRVLHGEDTSHRPAPVREAVGLLEVVEDHEEPGARGVEPAESRVRRPGARLIVVLRERLERDARREEVGEAKPDELPVEIALREVDVLVVHEQ